MMAGPRTSRKLRRGSRCGAWARSRLHVCRGWAMVNGRCRHHGGKSTGPRTPEGKRRVGEASAREWAKHRAALGLPPWWRSRDNQVCRQKRESAADYIAKHGPWQPDGGASS
jgi:hypothetical protein